MEVWGGIAADELMDNYCSKWRSGEVLLQMKYGEVLLQGGIATDEANG